MLTLQQMCGEAITRLFPFTISHVPTVTKESFGWAFQTLNNNGLNPLKVIPLNVTVRALQCSYADRKDYFKWMENTECLDLSNSELPDYKMSSLYSTLQIMYSGIYPKDNPLKVLRLPKEIPLDLEYLEKILRLCRNIEILGISEYSARLCETHCYTLTRIMEISPTLSIEVVSLADRIGIETKDLMRMMSPFKKRFSLIAPWDHSVEEVLQKISLNSQLIGLQFRRNVTHENEFRDLQQFFVSHRHLKIEFGISVNDRSDLTKLLTMIFPSPTENKAFVWNECVNLRVSIGLEEIEQEELNLLLSLRVKELHIQGAKKITQICSHSLNNLNCVNMSALKSIFLPNTEGKLTVLHCAQLIDIHAPKAYSIYVNACHVIEKIHAEGAELGRIDFCPELKEAVFPVASREVVINECNKLETFYAPSVRKVNLTNLQSIRTLNLLHATAVYLTNCTGLARVRLAKAESLSIYWCPRLKHLDAPKALTDRNGPGMHGLASLKTLKIPSFTAAVDLRAFPRLKALDARNASIIYVDGQRNRGVTIRSPRWSWPKKTMQAKIMLGLFVQAIVGLVILSRFFMGKTKSMEEWSQIFMLSMMSLTVAVANTRFIKNTVVPEITHIKRL